MCVPLSVTTIIQLPVLRGALIGGPDARGTFKEILVPSYATLPVRIAAVPQVLNCPCKNKPEENKEKAHLHYSSTVDSWAVGVLAYELLVG